MPGFIRGSFSIPVRVYIHVCDPPLCRISMFSFVKKDHHGYRGGLANAKKRARTAESYALS
jgi:hypothetical protein